MSATAMNIQITEQTYLDGECVADSKHEFMDGSIYAMAGASEAHNTIAGNVFGELRQQLKGSPCKPFIADMKVKAGPNYFYPDVMVMCDADEADSDVVKNAPTIIVEVLSTRTRKYDMTYKKIAYLNIPSLQEYLLVEQDKCEIEVFRRNDNWASTYYVLGDVITLDSIGVSITVEEIYERIENDDISAYLQEQG
jgi:Uma2 family endonuclease